MALVVKPVSINQSTYLRVPKDMEDLLTIMSPRVCTVDVQIDEKGCSLIYKFAEPVPDFTEGRLNRPLWLNEKELAA